MSLEIKVKELATAIGDDIQSLLGKIGDLTQLNTTSTSNLVESINEVITLIQSGGGGDLLSTNNLSDLADAVVARQNLDVRSTTQITNEIASAIASITLGGLGGLTQGEVDARVELVVGSAPDALDTLQELADALGNDDDFAGTITTALSKKVSFDVGQSLTGAQKLQACQNIGVGDPEADFVSTYETARDS